MPVDDVAISARRKSTVSQAQTREETIIPDHIARQIVLPAGHADLDALHEAYRWLRENMPVGKAVVEGYDPLWLVTKHADIQEVESKPEVFCAGGGPDKPGTHNPILTNKAGDDFTREMLDGSVRVLEALPFLDPPEHTEARQAVFPSLKPVSLKQYEEQIRELARQSIAHLEKISASGQTIDVVDDFAMEYPLRALMSMVGIPQDDYPRMLRLTQEFFGAADPEHQREGIEATPEQMAQQFSATVQDYYQYFDTIVEDRRKCPMNDLASVVANAKTENGELFSKTACYGRYIEFATAGHDTTSATLTGTLKLLAQHPDVLDRVKADTSLVPRLINESLRLISPVKHFMRQALSDYELRGQTIKAGDRLMPLFQSANRDAEVFDKPDEFNIDRRPNPHLAFGYGQHICPGQFVGKLELKIMLDELLPRLESVESAGSGEVVHTNFVGGLKHWPARFRFAA
ncbi:MAG: cytochrome P450 [Salinisphaeraceae bacterium]|nr:cytochrome P450 [Salinisphaeraceae bacterium]